MIDAKSDLMTPAEAAKILLVSPKTLANQRSRGQGVPYVRLPGGAIRYSHRAIAAVIKASTVIPRGAA